MTLDELNRQIGEALKLRHADPVAAAQALLALSQAASELDRRPALFGTLGLVLQTLPSTPATLKLRLTVAKAVVDEQPNNLMNLFILAEAFAANDDFEAARARCDDAELLARSERERSQLVALRQRIEAKARRQRNDE